ncbi:hypothetical protein EVA_13572 [gut metagenome]|uniref:Uncharacterized protein n=1 Tax=gut metagenome TaxID=749906 RepID=J9FTN8_9ZZZZ
MLPFIYSDVVPQLNFRLLLCLHCTEPLCCLTSLVNLHIVQFSRCRTFPAC